MYSRRSDRRWSMQRGQGYSAEARIGIAVVGSVEKGFFPNRGVNLPSAVWWLSQPSNKRRLTTCHA
jgi:hypothetical protein